MGTVDAKSEIEELDSLAEGQYEDKHMETTVIFRGNGRRKLKLPISFTVISSMKDLSDDTLTNNLLL